MSRASLILQLAQKAYDNISFYKLAYKARPDNIDAVPMINYADYHLADGVLDCINPTAELGGTLPPFHRAFRRMPYTVMETEEDINSRQERLGNALEDLGIGPPKKMLIITSEENGPFACDLSTGLGWEEFPASIYYHCSSNENLLFQITAHRPDWIIWCLATETIPKGCFDEHKIIIAHNLDQPVPNWAGHLLLFCDELNLLGSRPRGRNTFKVDQDQLVLEQRNEQLCVTTRQHEAFPMVRYQLPNTFEVLS